MTLANMSRLLHNPQPGPEGSMLKLYGSEMNQRVMRLAMEVFGDAALERETAAGEWGHGFLGTHGTTIGGGTSEIQRNTIGERVLGLPR
jgi:alkylation response protein AidB-like acyl-CoA dehydrogenase